MLDVDIFDLDIQGKLPGLDIYTQISWCFHIQEDPSSHPSIIDILSNGLERLSASFPWVAGHIVKHHSDNSNIAIKVLPEDHLRLLTVKDLRNHPSAPTFDILKKTNFPMKMLDENLFAPRMTIPTPEEPSTLPVFLAQATFITQGLFLTFVGHHSAMDMTGQAQVIRLLSKACHNESFTDQELLSGNLHRRHLIPFLDESYKPGPELAHQLKQPDLKSEVHFVDVPSKCIWSYFSFDSSSFVALKELATRTITPSQSYISTDDTLTAFIWQSVARARSSRLATTATSTLARAVDVRRYLRVSPMHTGLLQNMTYHTSPVQDLIVSPLGNVASQLRAAIDPQTTDLEYRTRALATFLDRTTDKSVVSITASVDPSKDIMISSWSKVNGYELDFNLGLGYPESVRRPRFIPVEGLIYLMPKAPSGELAVAICLREEDLECLKVDEEFVKYGKYIG
ncbi:hypothetical protein H0H93_002838 [Arthromyces matolae]|nr:hypothetical protein H0H93_002838 [Arthromyces matolae]